MLLRRFTAAIRRQDWFQVLVEILIVVAGILIALQVDNWNEERKARQQGELWRLQIIADLEQSIRDLQARRIYYGQALRFGEAALAAIWIVSALYYALTWSLTQKAYVLMGLGAALGLVVFITRSRDAGVALPKAFGGMALGLIALGTAATAAIGGTAVRSAEDVLANGRIVYIALRPVDPRSLIQGDYMAVAFNVDRLPAPRGVKGEVVAFADIDDRSIATIQGLAAPGAKPQGNQIAVKLRQKSRRWFVGTDAYFFEEGRADDFAHAKYGQFRLGADGRLLLVAMTDGNLKVLP